MLLMSSIQRYDQCELQQVGSSVPSSTKHFIIGAGVRVGGSVLPSCTLRLQTRSRRVRWLQLRFDFDLMTIRLYIKGH